MNKSRKRVFYNKALQCLFIETKPNSGEFKSNMEHENPAYNEIIPLAVINNVTGNYVDLTLYPAHIFKNYGDKFHPFKRDIAWVWGIGKPFLGYIEEIYDSSYGIRKILPDGSLSKKSIMTSMDGRDQYFTRPNEKYKVTTTIKIL